MKNKFQIFLIIFAITFSLFSCTTRSLDFNKAGSQVSTFTSDPVNTDDTQSDITTTTTTTAKSDTTSSDFVEFDDGHLSYLFSAFADGILVIEGTFSDSKITPNLEKVANEYFEKYASDDPARLPLAVYLVRNLNITKEDYMVYREKGEFTFTDEDIDKLFSDDDTVRETFRNPYTVHFEGKVYNIHMLKNLMKDNPEEYNKIPKGRL